MYLYVFHVSIAGIGVIEVAYITDVDGHISLVGFRDKPEINYQNPDHVNEHRYVARTHEKKLFSANFILMKVSEKNIII